MAREPLHVVILPWLAFGHMIPFFHLSSSLAKAGIRVSFISTPRNIQRLPEIPAELEPLFNFVQFHLPSVDGLPIGAEATVDLTMDQTQFLKVSYDLMDTQFKAFISKETVDWIILDFAPYWAVDIAREKSIPLIMFSVLSSVINAFFGHPDFLTAEEQKDRTWESLTSPPKWITFPSTVAFRPFEAKVIFLGVFETNASAKTDAERMSEMLNACQAVAMRTCKEYEGEYFDVATKVYRQAVIPVGLIPPVLVEKDRDNVEGHSSGEIFNWLDLQKNRSVVYVAFGSEAKLDRDQVFQIAHGLELADLPFLWALRKPMWAIDDDDALPSGFRSRTARFGVVAFGWVPQLDILSHPSIGGSLFHSGWGSIIETLQHGHTLVVLPLVIDQGLNARLLVEKGLAVEVERTDDGKFNGEDIAKALRMAMVSNEGEDLRLRARDMKSIFSDQGQL
ncbi:hypothetical protein IFM89_022405 [Coptis chinensis]|uniref:UDP-rhamnose:rhamnosyltransferase 1 n=1 Tax=Coptis chinensis TaxID=261450 RepID=A0A835I367_9MAGN|nr:hypothetical protein IFM89_022405 [Coptis chinensis]